MAYIINSADEITIGKVVSIEDLGGPVVAVVQLGSTRKRYALGVPLCDGCDEPLNEHKYCEFCECEG